MESSGTRGIEKAKSWLTCSFPEEPQEAGKMMVTRQLRLVQIIPKDLIMINIHEQCLLSDKFYQRSRLLSACQHIEHWLFLFNDIETFTVLYGYVRHCSEWFGMDTGRPASPSLPPTKNFRLENQWLQSLGIVFLEPSQEYKVKISLSSAGMMSLPPPICPQRTGEYSILVITHRLLQIMCWILSSKYVFFNIKWMNCLYLESKSSYITSETVLAIQLYI